MEDARSIASPQRGDTLLTPTGEVEALLGRCALHDQRALAELYEAVSARVLGLLLRMLRNRAVAEEALQDVMVRVWQRSDQYAAYRGRALTWILSIARYRAIDLLRAQRLQVTLDEVPEEALADPDAEEFSQAVSSQRSRRALDDCMQRLTPEQQRCLSLAYVDGYSQDEIATAIESPLGTVKSWVRRGLASLKRCMDA
ncbi:RNA polymerase sigma-70 factor (ECF subfamily) [Povalibacter uvarum]|uniref:RNA polymerase sigma-70 factor (ECF subfamily) n=1 Tax=Povalibacter uvarum TaxID=732238 RepID=A0A841HR14_9GAMM|nr:sigma-70 family RNA polymerase sigma factor [Povalibacter uvarum]MBB6095326.1 RNA polymerase sigma-70 factor (ECF subfamily) [Povalibacter uvarum]